MADQGIYVKLMVDMRDKLSTLKGAPLSCLIAIACHWDGERSWPSVDTIVRETGYTRPPVCSALDFLETEGWIESERRKHTSSCYRITTSLLQMGDSQSKDSLPSQPQSKEIKLSDDPESKDNLLPTSQSKDSLRKEILPKEEPGIKEEHTPAKARVCTLCKPIRDGSPPQQQILQKCHQLWRDRFGACPTQAEKKDRGILARLLNKHGPEFVMEVYETYLSDCRPYFSNHGWDIQTFYSSFDGLRLHHQKGVQNYAKRTGTDPADDPRI